MSEIETTANDSTEKGFLWKLANGDFGLAKTYWLYGVLVGFIVNIAIKPITSASLLVIVMLAYTLYEIPVVMGTWRAADKYQGSKIWALLAKVAVVLGAIMLVFTWFVIVGLLSQV